MRITNNMMWNNPGRINASMLGKALTSQVGRKSTTAMAQSVSRKNGFYNTFSNQMNSYAKIGSASEDLRSNAARLSANNNAMMEIAKHGGSRKGLLDQVKGMVAGYNSTIDGLNQNPSTLNNTYRKMLENTFSENSEALKSIGITVGKDKSLSIDEKKFGSVGIDKIEKVLGSESGFTARVASVSEGISNSTMRSPYANSYGYGYGYSSGYSPYDLYHASTLMGFGSGNSFLSSMMGSRYNFWM